MARYGITVTVESDNDYSDGDQIERLRDDLSMMIADYNCFVQISDVKIEELN